MSNKPDIKNSVLEKIRSGEVSMRPRALFTLRIAATAALTLLTLLVSVFVLSFVVFSVHESGEQFLLGFGTRGLAVFTTLFPWIPLLVAAGLLIALEALLRSFSFGYRVPLLRIFLWIIVVAALGTFLFGLTSVQTYLLDRADHAQLPILGPLYERVHDSHVDQGVYRGTITAFTSEGFTISHDDVDRDSDEGTWTIVPQQGFATSSLAIGEHVYIAGRLVHGVVYAYGIKQLSSQY